jgi:hypothetical protein
MSFFTVIEKKINPKIHLGVQNIPISQSNLKQQRAMLEISQPDFKLYYRAIVTKTAWH